MPKLDVAEEPATPKSFRIRNESCKSSNMQKTIDAFCITVHAPTVSFKKTKKKFCNRKHDSIDEAVRCQVSNEEQTIDNNKKN